MEVGEPSRYQGNNPRFAQPTEVACFSRDASRRVHFDRRALRKYSAPPLPAALDVGFDSYIPKDDADEPAPLSDVIAALSHHRVATVPGQLITFRNNMNKLMLTPFCPKDDWVMEAETLPNGTVHLHVRDTARKIAEERGRDERGKRMSYWGYRFEQLCTAGAAASASAAGGYRVPSPCDPDSYAHLYGPAEATTLRQRHQLQIAAAALSAGAEVAGSAAGGGGDVVNANEEFCCVVKLKLEEVRILMAAEIDCADEEKKYVELKTSKQIASQRDSASFEKFKLLKFWLQSFLAGVPRVLVGFRDDAGFVRELQSLQTLAIPRAVRGKDYWDPSVCLNFGRIALEWLLSQLRKLPPGTRVAMRYEPAQRAVVLSRAGAPAAAPADVDTAGVKRPREE